MVTMANGSQTQSQSIDIVHPSSSLSIHNALYVSGAPFNLLSISQLTRSLDCIISFINTSVSLQDRSTGRMIDFGCEFHASIGFNNPLLLVRQRPLHYLFMLSVATFCRVRSAFSSKEVALPVEAEEGFTGLLECSKKRDIPTDLLLEAPIEEQKLEITQEDLLKVDNEGRCIITDHGHFVLFNIYGPRAEHDDEERCRFKFIFFKILQRRWDFLLNEGKRVFVVGDLNIAPTAIDRCDADPEFEKNLFRKWLRSLLREYGGQFFDAFRSKNPGRKEAYTCFSPRIGAEEFNYGSRIDHILIAGSCLHQKHDIEGHNFLSCHVEACDIMSQFRRGNCRNVPRWRGGRNIKLEGSDHVPVHVILRDIPDLPLHNTPSLAVRYIPEVRGWQQSIVSFLVKGQVTRHCMPSDSSNDNNTTAGHEECEIRSEGCSLTTEQEFIATSQDSPDPSISKLKLIQKPYTSLNNDSSLTASQKSIMSSEVEKREYMSGSTTSMKKRTRHSTCSQLTLKSFFKQPKTVGTCDDDSLRGDATSQNFYSEKDAEEVSQMMEQEVNQDLQNNCEMSAMSVNTYDDDSEISFPCERESNRAAVIEWQKIQQKMKMTLPICKGHGEPCVARSVKREGPNRGRLFYVCARAQGPASNPEANCGYFQWGSSKSKKAK
ncbi:DNA-(apurinic or apyrimidinic site) endonuclease 2-like isoform X1 [Zingiber officinale]|uniref:DNA-(apurinic or apyrimidinic site) endonuclease 2-like isoform X1 n=1 Tax=Zingiber officinale TaxID=94328 RepID=UPI001C4DC125|nr:DNA-(apurinic or apyrimidinic site) endonuclease 2-like isoform X1 [Zingiber officinale]XP_042393659.1 DNA-(apurinic or apyrimidinic site) endonuclease 2-like isoform X1 [Zingiber officinale]